MHQHQHQHRHLFLICYSRCFCLSEKFSDSIQREFDLSRIMLSLGCEGKCKRRSGNLCIPPLPSTPTRPPPHHLSPITHNSSSNSPHYPFPNAAIYVSSSHDHLTRAILDLRPEY
jgi:hypothetical protein